MDFVEQTDDINSIDQASHDSKLEDEVVVERVPKEQSVVNESYIGVEENLESLSLDTHDLLEPIAENPKVEIVSQSGFDEDVDEEPLPVTKANCLSIQSDGDSLIYGHIGRITAVCQLTDGYLASGSDFPDKSIRIWSCPRSTESTCEQVIKCPHKILSLLALPNNRIAAGLGNKTIRVFNTLNGALMTDWHSGPATCLSLLPDNNILSSSGDNFMKIWRRHDGAWLGTLRGHTDAVTCMAIASKAMIIISGSKDCTIKLWQLKSHIKDAECQHTLAGHSSVIDSVCVTACNEKLISSAFNEIRVWDLKTITCIASFDELCSISSVSSSLPLQFAAMIADPNQVVIIGWGSAKDHSTLAKIIDIQTGQVIKEIKDPEQSKSKERIFCVTALQDGRIVVAGEDKVLRILQ